MNMNHVDQLKLSAFTELAISRATFPRHHIRQNICLYCVCQNLNFKQAQVHQKFTISKYVILNICKARLTSKADASSPTAYFADSRKLLVLSSISSVVYAVDKGYVKDYGIICMITNTQRRYI